MGRRAEVQRICKNLYASHIFLIKLAAGTDTGKTGKYESKVQKRYSGQFLVFHQANFQLII